MFNATGLKKKVFASQGEKLSRSTFSDRSLVLLVINRDKQTKNHVSFGRVKFAAGRAI